MLNRGDKGQEVTSLQEMLLALGYALPRWGADGDLGLETLDAVAHFGADHAWAGYGDAEVSAVSDAMLATVKQCYDAVAAPLVLPGLEFHDQRAKAARKGCLGGRRRWEAITGVTLHQTACDFGSERPDRWDTLWAHLGCSREGNVFWAYDLEQVVWHGNGFNMATVGIECEGNYAGVVGDRSTVWQPGTGELMVVTPELVKAAQDAVRWVCAVVAQHGGHVGNLFAHRQSAGSRRADPGQELWQQVALPVMAELGLSDGGPQYKVGEGRPVPAAWNPAYAGNAY